MTLKPVYHGPDHKPEGDDPIKTGVIHNIGDSGEPTFENGWTGTGSFRLIVGPAGEGDGKKALEVGASVSGGTPGTAAFTLPAGYAPIADTPKLIGVDDMGAIVIWRVLATGEVLVGL